MSLSLPSSTAVMPILAEEDDPKVLSVEPCPTTSLCSSPTSPRSEMNEDVAADILTKLYSVQWQCLVQYRQEAQWTDYDDDSNQKIEEAYQKDSPSIAIPWANGNQWIISLHWLTQTNHDSQTVRNIRRLIITHGDGAAAKI